MPTPKYVFKIVTAKPDLKSTKVSLTELDEQSGFIHLSSGPQIPRTCNRFFSSVEILHILKFPYDKLKPNISGKQLLVERNYSRIYTAIY